jgi:hypothetical protein
MHVLKGKKLPGHMGHKLVTVQNLEVVEIDLENNIILVKGNVPGPKKSLVIIKSAIKHEGKVNAQDELITYVEEVVEETPVEETPAEVTEEPVATEEVKEEPFTPVNVDEIKDDVTPVIEPEIKNDSNIIDIEDLLKDAPTVQEPKVEQAPVVEETAPVVPEETPVVEEPKVEVPVEPALEKTVEFKPDVLVEEKNTPVPETVQPTVESTAAPAVEITPVEPVQAPTVETVTAPVSMPESTPVVEQPVSQNTELYSDVSKLYSGMNEAKTGNEPHRVIPVNSNDFAKNDVKVNSLVMNNAA